MMHARFSIFISVPLLTACSNGPSPSGSGNQPSCDAGSTPKSSPDFFLTQPQLAPRAHLGGFLVFDKLEGTSYAEKGYANAEFIPDQKCTSLFEVRERAGRHFVKFSATGDTCYTPFFRASRNQRLLVNLPGTPDYIELKPKDERFSKSAQYLSAFDNLNAKMRSNELIQYTNHPMETVIGFYAENYNGMNMSTSNIFRSNLCFGAQTPSPAACLWPNEMHFDEVEIIVDKSQEGDVNILKEQTLNANKEMRAALSGRLSPTRIDNLFSISEKMIAVEAGYLRRESLNNAHRMLAQDVTSSRSRAFGLKQADVDAVGILSATLFAPDWLERVKVAAAAKTDRKAKVDAIFDDSAGAFVRETIAPTFAQLFEGFMDLRTLFATHKDLIGIATNYVDPTGKAVGMSFKTLSPFASPKAAEIAGIVLEVDAKGNLLLTHPGKDKNRNLTLDGHMGSVVTFGGVPLLPFNPLSIDQSDGAALLPLPKSRTKAAKAENPSDSETKEPKSTVGEGSGKGCT